MIFTSEPRPAAHLWHSEPWSATTALPLSRSTQRTDTGRQDQIRLFFFFFFKVVQHEGMSGHPLVLPFMRGWRAHGVLVVSAGEVQGSGGCT